MHDNVVAFEGIISKHSLLCMNLHVSLWISKSDFIGCCRARSLGKELLSSKSMKRCSLKFWLRHAVSYKRSVINVTLGSALCNDSSAKLACRLEHCVV